ncbi:MAG: GNAT family N-acetyltransferase [Acidobacteriota bacterium]|nr:GNAT family N-acetyltransferase [Acidobacteriota bacterium]
MIRTATRADLPRIAELFSIANNAPYDLVRVAEEKCFGAGVSGAPDVRIYGDVAGISVTCGRSLRIIAVDRASRRRGVGSALLREAQARGSARIVAAEAGNYFTPGVATSDETTIGFFTRRGYREIATTQNLIATDLPIDVPEGVFRATRAERDRVLKFIENEFGRIWRFEAALAFENDPPTMFYVVANSRIAGFATHDANNRALGFFGPTGVARAHRGRGLGARLLHASLADLRRLGHDRVVIPWTDAVDFYRKACGARVAERFVTLGV